METTGSYGTVFSCRELSHSDDPVEITTSDGQRCVVPTSDLMHFAQELVANHDKPPIEVNAKVSRYLRAAVEASIEGKMEAVRSAASPILEQMRSFQNSPYRGEWQQKLGLTAGDCRPLYDLLRDNKPPTQ